MRAMLTRMLSPSCNPKAADVLRLYRSMFGRAPDDGGVNYWLGVLAAGATLADIREWFGQSAEFSSKYVGMTDAEYVAAIYRNVLGREADVGGFNYWVGLVTEGLSRVELVYWVSASAEFRNRFPYTVSPFCEWVAERINATEVAPGIVHYAANGVNVAYVNLTQPGCRVRVPSSTALRGVGFYGGDVSINGNWFGSPAVFYGLSVSDGVGLGGLYGDPRMSILGFGTAGASITNFFDEGLSGVPEGVVHGVTGKELVTDGVVSLLPGDPTFTARAPRTAAGLNASGDVLVLVTVDGRSMGRGVTGVELGELLVSLGVHDGIVLDGGGSSAMALKDRVVSRPSDGTVRRVANQLVVDAGTYV